MKTPDPDRRDRARSRSRARDRACTIVSTNEALLDLAVLPEIPTSEWADLSIDITPREYVLEYLQHSFPTLLFELYSDEDGNLYSRPAYDTDSNPVISREAVDRRDRMIEHLASLPPVQGALDQILHRFGTDLVAEVTGRSRRIVKREDRLCVETRPASANFAETAAFMDDDKRILVFSDAGGTGRSNLIERRNAFEIRPRPRRRTLRGRDRLRLAPAPDRWSVTEQAAAVIDSHELLATSRRYRARRASAGTRRTRIAFTGGPDCNDHVRIWEALDKIRKHRHGAIARRRPAQRRTHRRLLGRPSQSSTSGLQARLDP